MIGGFLRPRATCLGRTHGSGRAPGDPGARVGRHAGLVRRSLLQPRRHDGASGPASKPGRPYARHRTPSYPGCGAHDSSRPRAGGTGRRDADPANGLLRGTNVGVVTESFGYNAFGEVTSYTETAGSTSLLAIGYTRDTPRARHEGRAVVAFISISGGRAPVVGEERRGDHGQRGGWVDDDPAGAMIC